MAGSSSHDHGPQQLSMLTYGLLFGPAMGMLVALVLVGDEALALGLTIGAAAGVLLGALLDVERERRSGR